MLVRASRNLASVRVANAAPSLDVQLIEVTSSRGEVDGVDGGEIGRYCTLSKEVVVEVGEIIRKGMAGEGED